MGAYLSGRLLKWHHDLCMGLNFRPSAISHSSIAFFMISTLFALGNVVYTGSARGRARGVRERVIYSQRHGRVGEGAWGRLVPERGTRVGDRVQLWSVRMHFNVNGFKIITLHSNFQTFLQHFTRKKLDIGCFVLNMKIIWCFTILKKHMK